MPICGIGGFSLSAESKINSKELANSLLTKLESRGGMASGFAYQTEEESGYFKAPINGASLSLKTLPKYAKSVIVHTRLATHGGIDDNRNNHPIISPNQEIALVHNGVIYNHEVVRLALAKPIDFDVDTAVIPALIEEDRSLKRLTELDGDAAIAWFDNKNRGVLNLARLDYSPMCIAQVEDGSLIFASTESILWDVLIQLDLTPTYLENVKQYTHFQVRNGIISHWEELPEPSYNTRLSYDYSYYRHQTSGGKGTYYYDDPQTGMTTIGSKSWVDELWDEDDDDEVRDWNESFRYSSLPKPPASSYYSNYYFFVKTREKSMAEEFTWYHDDEYGEFKNDIWYLKGSQPDMLLDYGRLDFDTGVYYSYLDNPDNERADVKELGLTI